jgi:hypothetical protein
MLAREAAEAFGEMAALYRRHFGLSPDEARAKASQTDEGFSDRALSRPPEETSWHDLGELARRDPELALQRWLQVKEAACDEVASGHLAARAVEEHGGGRPADRARFLAVREQLAASLGRPSPAEWLLIDQLAGIQMQLWEWQRVVTTYTAVVADDGLRSLRLRQPFEPALVTEAEALENAVAMVERLQGLFLRMFQALQAGRRGPRVLVRSAGQVNVAQGNQLNVCGRRA